jgi:hypothetical protein
MYYKSFSIKNLSQIIFLFSFFFIPNKDFGLYYTAVFFSVSILYWVSDKIRFSYLGLICILSISFIYLVRELIFLGGYDLKELLKFYLFYLLLNQQVVTKKMFHYFLFAFILIDFLFGVFQFFKLDFAFVDYVNHLYASEGHYNMLENVNVRSVGLTSGAGHRGPFLFLCLLYIVNIDNIKNTKIINIFICLLFISILLSQSKTTYVALSVFLIYKYFRQIIKYFIFLIPLVFFLDFDDYLFELYSSFNELGDLVNNGLNTSSYISRWDNYKIYFDGVMTNALSILFGIGRNYFESIGSSPAFDSDYIYILVNLGFLGLLVFFLCVCYSLTKYYTKDRLLFETLLFGLLIGFSLNFFFDLKVLTFLGILFSMRLNKYKSDDVLLDTSKL